MANSKTGFAFYNVDTDRYQDIRIKRLKKTFGCIGIAVYDYILCEIYRVRGCFLEWGESTAFDVAEYFNLKESQVNEIVKYCCAVGLFDKALLTSGIVTSASIQKRYIEMSTRAKRKDIYIPEQCLIIPEESDIIPEESPKLPEVCDRVEKSKVNTVEVLKIVEDRNIVEVRESVCCAHAHAQAPPTQKPKHTSVENLEKRNLKFMGECVVFVEKYGKEMVRKFYDYWTEPNKSQSKMRFEMEKTWDLSRRFSTWDANEIKFNSCGTYQKNTGASSRRTSPEQLAAAIYGGFADAESNNPQ